MNPLTRIYDTETSFYYMLIWIYEYYFPEVIFIENIMNLAGLSVVHTSSVYAWYLHITKLILQNTFIYLSLVIITKVYWLYGIHWISLATLPYCPSILSNLLDSILYPQKADECKFLWVCQHQCIHELESMGEHCL